MNEQRHQARWRRRRIIYNNDGDDAIEARSGVEHEYDVSEALTVRASGDLVQDFLDARSTPLIGTQVDSNWFASCMAGLTFSHHTKLGGFYDKRIPLELVEKYGRDTLQVQLDFSHEHGMEAVWALRMNDVHDAHPPGSRRWTYGLAPFKKEHPEFMMGQEGDWDKYGGNPKANWTGLDFAVPEVREHIFAIIQEVAQNYDVDCIGMEFFKYFPFFRESLQGNPVEPEHLELMNDLLRRIRRMADEQANRRGRPLLLAAHTPFNLADSIHVGVDLETWLAEGLIDQLMPGGNLESVFCSSYSDIIALGHKYEVPVYPCVSWGFWDRWAFLGLSDGKYRQFRSWIETLYGGQPERAGKPSFILVFNGWEGTLAAWRGAASNLFNAGADGLYLFNPAFGEPQWWREIGETATMAGKDKLYGIERFAGKDSFEALDERILETDVPVAATFQVGEDPSTANVKSVDFRLHLWDYVPGDDVSVRLNGEPVDGMAPQDPGRKQEEGQWLQGNLNANQVRRGENAVEVRLRKRGESASSSIALDAVQLYVHCES